jgi:hypothetical protein
MNLEVKKINYKGIFEKGSNFFKDIVQVIKQSTD